jgi:hypothetical protein
VLACVFAIDVVQVLKTWLGLLCQVKLYFPCKEEQNTASNLSKSISLTSNSRKFWTALLEMSGEGLLGLLAEGVPDSAAAATALP